MVQNQVKVKKTQEPNHLLSGVVRSRNKKKKNGAQFNNRYRGKYEKLNKGYKIEREKTTARNE